MENQNTQTQSEILHPDEVIEDMETLHEKQQLPLSYVMYLTMRSQFIDELAKTDLEVLHKWKEYEDKIFIELQNKSIEN
jgi:hypothetical protein